MLNAKVGAPEDAWVKGQPAWSVGFFGLGFEKDVNDQNALYGVLGKTIPGLGSAQFGAYYGLNEGLLPFGADGADERFGLLAGMFRRPSTCRSSTGLSSHLGYPVRAQRAGSHGRRGLFLCHAFGRPGHGSGLLFRAGTCNPVDRAGWSLQLDVDLDFRPGGQ